MERIIYVDIEPQKPFLTQYTRRLLLDCLKGVKQLKENQYIELQDIFTSTTKINTTQETITLYFTIIPFETLLEHKLGLPTNDIESLNHKISQLEELLLEYHLDLELPWNHLSFLQVGQELHHKGLSE